MSYPRILTACRVSTRSGLNVDARSGSRFLSFPTLRGGADSFRHIRLPALYLLWTRRRSACAGEPPAATDSIGGSIRCAAEWLFFVFMCCWQHGRDALGGVCFWCAFGPGLRDEVFGRVTSTLA